MPEIREALKMLSCASGPIPAGDSVVANYGRESGRVWVRGPWDAITSSTNMDAMLSACALFQRPSRPVHAPPEEAARVEFPLDLPKEERLIIPGTVLKAVQLAMEDFLPWDVRPHRGATPEEICLYQRESHDVTTAPGPDGVLFVRFTVRDDACTMGGVILAIQR